MVYPGKQGGVHTRVYQEVYIPRVYQEVYIPRVYLRVRIYQGVPQGAYTRVYLGVPVVGVPRVYQWWVYLRVYFRVCIYTVLHF